MELKSFGSSGRTFQQPWYSATNLAWNTVQQDFPKCMFLNGSLAFTWQVYDYCEQYNYIHWWSIKIRWISSKLIKRQILVQSLMYLWFIHFCILKDLSVSLHFAAAIVLCKSLEPVLSYVLEYIMHIMSIMAKKWMSKVIKINFRFRRSWSKRRSRLLPGQWKNKHQSYDNWFLCLLRDNTNHLAWKIKLISILNLQNFKCVIHLTGKHFVFPHISMVIPFPLLLECKKNTYIISNWPVNSSEQNLQLLNE